MKGKKLIKCPLCQGQGGFWDTLDGKPPPGIWEPPEFYWDACPECEGLGTIWEEEWGDDPYESILHRSEEHIQELRTWVEAYRGARRVGLPPEEAQQVATLTLYGPLPIPRLEEQ